tara:strand:+ start:2015 stop:2926 length:912 start_codon:yes stop_codon:yes gene_type:complete
MSMMKSIYLFIALVTFYATFFVITPWVFKDLHDYKQKYSTKTFSRKDSILLVDGVCDFGNTNVLNTSNPHKGNFIEMPPSMNKSGGIEFSYTFWAKISDLKSDTTLFIKGANPVKSSLSDELSKVKDAEGNVIVDDLIKCPMVNMSKENITISFNTAREIHNEMTFEIGANSHLESTDSNPRWFLFTLAFREGDFTTEYGMKAKGVIVDLYINEQHVKNKFIDNDSMRLNDGDFYFFPKGSKDNQSMMGNLYYHNWALNSDDVKSIWAAGYNDKGCTVASTAQSGTIHSQMNDLGRHGANLFI